MHILQAQIMAPIVSHTQVPTTPRFYLVPTSNSISDSLQIHFYCLGCNSQGLYSLQIL